MKYEEFKILLDDFENPNLEFRTDLGMAEDRDRDIKVLCSFANGQGGKVIFGVSEDGRSRKVVGVAKPQVLEVNLHSKVRGKTSLDTELKLDFIDVGGNACVVVHCPKGAKPPYKANGKIYVRKGSNTMEANEEEVATLYRNRSNESFDRSIVASSNVLDLDLENMKLYLKKKSSLAVESDFENLAFRMGYLAKDTEEILRPTIAGILLFGKNPQQFLPQAKIKADAKFSESGEDWDDIAEIEGNIFEQVKEVEQFLKRNIRVSAKILGFERVENAQFPIEALREAVVNAIVHRDYGANGSEILCRVRDETVEVENPGDLVAPLTIEAILKGDFYPATRNPILASTLVDLGLMDKRGTGIVRMAKLMTGYDSAKVTFKSLPQGFRVSFYSKSLTTPKELLKKAIIIPHEIIAQASLDDDHKKILQYVEQNGKISASQCAVLLDKTKQTALRKIDYLLEWKILEPTTSNKNDPNIAYRVNKIFDIAQQPKISNKSVSKQNSLF